MTTRGQSVAARIREGVLSGAYSGGTKLNEADLAQALGVSRTPVRSALAALGAEGLLEYTPNSGYVVRSYTPKEIAGIYEVRATLEGLAARLAAEQGVNDLNRGLMHKTLTGGRALIARGEWSDGVRARWMEMNETFHHTLVASADNAHLLLALRKAREIPLINHIRFRWFDFEHMIRSVEDHVEIFEAMVGGQGMRADALAREHVMRSGRRIIEGWSRTEVQRPDRAARRPRAA